MNSRHADDEVTYSPLPPEFVRSLALNFVALCWTDETQGKYQAVPGFVVSVRGLWWFVTAGHILGTIQRAIARGQRLVNFVLDDAWNLESRFGRAVPFAFEQARVQVLGEDDIDFGIIHLPAYYANQLAANNVKPFDESVFEPPWPESFDWYALLGLPTDLETRVDPTTVSRDCLYLKVEPCSSPPPELVKSADRFYGVVDVDDSDPRLTGLDGMSGGPLFGFKRVSETQLRFWIVGVQSGWHRPTRTIVACYLEPLLRYMATKADEIIAAAEADAVRGNAQA